MDDALNVQHESLRNVRSVFLLTLWLGEYNIFAFLRDEYFAVHQSDHADDKFPGLLLYA